jgi:hypothetical protein
LHLRPGGDPNQRIVERRRAAFEDGAFATRVPDRELTPSLRAASRLRRKRQFGAQLLTEFEGEYLAKAPNTAALQHDIAADPQFQAVQRRLEREPAPVNRGGERKH